MLPARYSTRWGRRLLCIEIGRSRVFPLVERSIQYISSGNSGQQQVVDKACLPTVNGTPTVEVCLALDKCIFVGSRSR